VKIINRYVLKEHLGPFVFALSALTSLLLLQYIARRFGDLVGKGLAWDIIVEFFLLSIPFTLAMTLPMAVLVAVLYAFSRLASENEVTALKAGGISTRSLLVPALSVATLLALFMVFFNDQLLSRANHELATLQLSILRTKPTFTLKPQVINTVKEGQLYLKAEQILQDTSGRMRGVTIYDVSDGSKRRSIYADSGTLVFAANKRDLVMNLYKGLMMTAPTDKPGQLTRIYYNQDKLKVREVANSFQSISADTNQKGEREMTVCEMQGEYEQRERNMRRAYADSLIAAWKVQTSKGKRLPRPAEPDTTKPGGIGRVYCNFITKYLKVKEAAAAEPPPSMHVRQDSAKKAAQKKTDSVFVLIGTILKKVPRDKVPPGAFIPETVSTAVQPVVPNNVPVPANRPVRTGPDVAPVAGAAAPPPAAAPNTATPIVAASDEANSAGIELADSKIRLDDARHWRNRYGVEIQKKFSLAFACIVFVLVGAPIALRFPRGGVGLVMGVGFVVFAIYYIGLIGGESLANKNYVSPVVAMWIDNAVFLVIGIVLIAMMGNENTTTRGGQFGERVDAVRAWFERRRGRGASA
jgi:lipopolysaccharide export system permease protein